MNNNIVYSDNPTRKAGFITEDGKFINLQENKIQLIGYKDRDVIHSDFANYFHKQDINVSELNLIRFNDGAYIYINEEAYVELNEQEPTEAQYQALLKWFDFLMLNSKKDFIYIGLTTRGNKFRFINKTHSEGLLPEELIKEVKKIYNTASS